MSRIVLCCDTSDTSSLSYPNIREFERSVLRDSAVTSIRRGPIFRFIASSLKRAQSILGMAPPHEIPIKTSEYQRFSILLGAAYRRCADYIRPGRKSAYFFDATTPWVEASRVVSFCNEAGINDLFVCHPEFAESITRAGSKARVHCVPVGIDPQDYISSTPKDIDVFEFGRKLGGYHSELRQGLGKSGVTHFYSFLKTHEAFLDTIRRARIIISFPRSVTDGEPVTPMLTPRYFQAMAAKSLIVGSCPPLLSALFGFNPVIEADLKDPCGQIKSILDQFDKYSSLIDRNFEVLMSGHTWEHRWAQIKEHLRNC